MLEDTDARRAAAGSIRHPRAVCALYCLVMAVNGGMCGAFGPSLESFHRHTHLSHAALGSAVMQNRLAKLLGTVAWAYYASTLESPRKIFLRPHAAVGIALLVIGACCVILGTTTSGVNLEAVMVVSGAAYGFNDSACSLLTLWLWQGDPRRQRAYVALINVFFTAGAFITPIFIAASLHFMGDFVWPAFDLLSVLSIGGALAAACLPSPRPKLKEDGGKGNNGEMIAVELEAADDDAEEAEESGYLRTPGSAEGNLAVDRGTESKTKGAALVKTQNDSKIELYLIIGTGIVAFMANGCEHAVATWLTTYGTHKCGLNEEVMAIMTSNYWTVMSIGRVVWAVFSGLVKSAWPVLFFNATCCLLSGLLFVSNSEGIVWGGAIMLGVGISSSFPALITLAPEVNIEMTPRKMAYLQLGASAGEMVCPYLMGIVFDFRLYHWFGPFTLVCQVMSVIALTVIYNVTAAARSKARA